MNTLADRLRLAMNGPPKIKQVDLANACGIKPPSVSDWLNGRTTGIDGKNLLAASRFLGVRPDWLASGKGAMRQEYAVESNVEPAHALRAKGVPLISWVQAGDWCEAHDPYPVGDAEMWLPAADNYGENAYALRVRGASMEPRFREGEIIVINPDGAADSGKFVIARKDGSKEVTFKQLIREGGEAYLKAINPQWPEPIIRMDEAWHICGVVVCKMEIF